MDVNLGLNYPQRMHTTLIFSAKGGASKTTLSRELAVAATLAGRRTAIVDLDKQRGLTNWFGRREAETPSLVALAPPFDVSPLAKAGIDEVYIDTPPGVPSYIAHAIASSDVVLVPCRPSPDDLTAAANVVELLAGRRWFFVLVQTLPRSRLSDSVLRQLAALGRVAPVSIGSRQDYPAAAIEGLAAVEFPGTKSAGEVTELRSYLMSVMEAKNAKTTKR